MKPLGGGVEGADGKDGGGAAAAAQVMERK